MIVQEDRYSRYLSVGDIVECLVDGYRGQYKGQQSPILAIHENGIILRNSYHPHYNSSIYSPYNFRRVSSTRRIKKESNMNSVSHTVAVAILVDESNVLEYLSLSNTVRHMSAESLPKLKKLIEQRLKEYPRERWLVLNSHSIAYISSPIVYEPI